jgi:stress response protein YsnF
MTQLDVNTLPGTAVVDEREPITDADRASAYSGGDITEEEHEVTLRAETPVAGTETEAVERVGLGKETVSDTDTVSGGVRKEQIDLDDPTGTARDPRG